MARSLYICYFGINEPLVQTQVIPYLRELVKGGHEISLLTFEPDAFPRWNGNAEVKSKNSKVKGNCAGSTTPSPMENIGFTPPIEGGEPEGVGERGSTTPSPMENIGSTPPIQGGEPASEDEIRAELAAQGIEWHWLRYHKWPSVPATLYDILNGANYVRKLFHKKKFDILHARSHVPTLMAAIGRPLVNGRPKLLFDIRGFMPEEYVDAGIWSDGGLLYKGAKRVEQWLLRESDGFVVLTEKAREILFPDAVPQPEGGWLANDNLNPPAAAGGTDKSARPVEVIPCCVDQARFQLVRESTRDEYQAKLGIAEKFVVAYVGAFGGWYLTEELADFFSTMKSKYPDSYALILTQTHPEIITKVLKDRGYPDSDYFVGRVSPEEVPKYLTAADAAVSLIKNCYSKKASSPTKNAEYLACGLPIIANSGIGDTDAMLLEDRTGVIVDEMAPKGYDRALRELKELIADPELAARCRNSAELRFDLSTVGGERYRSIYRELVNENT